MPNSIAPTGKDHLLTIGNWVADNFDVILVDSQELVYIEGTHLTRADIPALGRIATQPLLGKTCVGGLLNANDVVFPNVTGDQFEYVFIVANTGVEANDAIICVFDTATGLPLTPNGNDINSVWNVGGIIQF